MREGAPVVLQVGARVGVVVVRLGALGRGLDQVEEEVFVASPDGVANNRPRREREDDRRERHLPPFREPFRAGRQERARGEADPR